MTLIPARLILRATVFLASALLPLSAFSQNTSNVFSPDVRPGTQAIEWRFAYNPEGERYASRVHYQYGFDEQWRMRLILAGAGSENSDFETRYIRWETQWQFLENEKQGWDSALRFEAQLADGDNRPSRVRLGWTSKWDLADPWQFRFVFIAGHQLGAESEPGTLLETRYRLAYALNDQLNLSIDAFSDFNTTDRIGSFDEQEHQAGPLLQWDLDNGWDLNIGALFGLSDAASDEEYRIHAIYGF